MTVQLLTYFVGQTVAKLGEHLVVKDTPHYLIIYINTLRFATQVLTAVLHIKEPEVGGHVDMD